MKTKFIIEDWPPEILGLNFNGNELVFEDFLNAELKKGKRFAGMYGPGTKAIFEVPEDYAG